MQIFSGKGVYGAVAVGAAKVLRRQQTSVSRIHIDDPERELQRVNTAKKSNCTA